ncbi:MAG: ArsR/SmtB family transcription factor [Sphingomicrobium sp.]
MTRFPGSILGVVETVPKESTSHEKRRPHEGSNGIHRWPRFLRSPIRNDCGSWPALTRDGRNYVSQLAREQGISRPLLHLHLQKLEEAGLITSRLELSSLRGAVANVRFRPITDINSFGSKCGRRIAERL